MHSTPWESTYKDDGSRRHVPCIYKSLSSSPSHVTLPISTGEALVLCPEALSGSPRNYKLVSGKAESLSNLKPWALSQI